MCSRWDKAMRINGQDEYKPGPTKRRSEYAEACVWFQISINVKIKMYCISCSSLKWRSLLPGYRQKHLNCILPSEKNDGSALQFGFSIYPDLLRWNQLSPLKVQQPGFKSNVFNAISFSSTLAIPQMILNLSIMAPVVAVKHNYSC